MSRWDRYAKSPIGKELQRRFDARTRIVDAAVALVKPTIGAIPKDCGGKDVDISKEWAALKKAVMAWEDFNDDDTSTTTPAE